MVANSVDRLLSLILPGWRSSSGFNNCTHKRIWTRFKLPWAKESNKAIGTSKPYLVAGGHDCYNWEFLHLHLCDSYSGQEADLRWTHVSALRQHTLSTLDIVTYRPVCDKQENRPTSAFTVPIKLILFFFFIEEHVKMDASQRFSVLRRVLVHHHKHEPKLFVAFQHSASYWSRDTKKTISLITS